MKLQAHRSFPCAAAVLAALALSGCRVNPTDPSLAQSSEGSKCPQDALLEDGEDNNNQVVVQDGRAGYIYTYVDSAGSSIDPAGGAQFKMTPGGANGSDYALRIHGSIGTGSVVYAAMGMNLTDPRGPYDMSKYQGISFYAKKGPGTTSKVRMKMPDKNTDPDGGVCGACANDFGIELRLTEEWQQYIVPFSALEQESGWGSPRPRSLDTEAVYALQFQINDKGKDFDVWVDELRFTGCE